MYFVSQLHQHNLSTCVSRLGGAPVHQLYQYKPSLLQPQFLQFTYLSNRSVIFCYSHCTCSYSQYTIQHMYCVLHHLWHISAAYWEEMNIYCYVHYISLLWWLREDGTSVSKHVAIYICYKCCITQYILWMIYWLFCNLAVFHCTFGMMTPWGWHLSVETCSSIYIYMLQMVYHTVHTVDDILTVLQPCTVSLYH